MTEMSDSSAENNEFQFYLLLVRQYIFQLPEEDERVRAAAWMVHLRRLREAKDLKLRNDYIKLLLFAMHSRCLIGPFAQTPQKDKGLEYFPQHFTFPDMMRHLIQESNAQPMRYYQSIHENPSSLASGEPRVKIKVQDNLEENMPQPEMFLTQTQNYQDNTEDNVRPTECNQSFVSETTASSVSGLASKGYSFSPNQKLENLSKLPAANRKDCQFTVYDRAINREGNTIFEMRVCQNPQLTQDSGVLQHHSHEPNNFKSNSLPCEEDSKHNLKFCSSQIRENNETLKNSRHFTDTLKTNIQDEINMAHYSVENNIHNETYSPFKHLDHSCYQHCHHHYHHKPPVCHSNDRKTSALEMGLTGRKYIGQTCRQMPSNEEMTACTKRGFSNNCGHSSFTDFRGTTRNQENTTCWLNDISHNNFGTNPLISGFQADYRRYIKNLNTRQMRENCNYPHIMNTIPGAHSCPLGFNNGKCNAEYSSSVRAEERDIPLAELMQRNNMTQCYFTNKSSIGNCVDSNEKSGPHKPATRGSGSAYALNMKHCYHKVDPKTSIEEQQIPVPESEMQFQVTDELSANKDNVRQRNSAQEIYLQGPSNQISHAKIETQENISSNQRYPGPPDDTSIDPNAKSSEFNSATFRACLSADMGAYATGYAAGYTAGYAEGIAAALHSQTVLEEK